MRRNYLYITTGFFLALVSSSACQGKKEVRPVLDSYLSGAQYLGPNSIRMVSMPSLGDKAIVVELTRGDQGRATGRAFFFSRRDRIWPLSGTLPLEMTDEDYGALATLISHRLESYARHHVVPSQTICLDGTTYRIELSVLGHLTQHEDSPCQSEDFKAVVEMIGDLVKDQVARHFRP